MIATVFLAVLVLGLALGNVFLALTSPERAARQLSKENGKLGLAVQESDAESNEMQESQLSFEQAADKERIRMLNKRIERLEQLLLKINNSKFIARKLNGTGLYQKLSNFDQFKQDTKLEIAALRQRLDRIQPQKKKPKPDLPKISDEKLRDLVFRATH